MEKPRVYHVARWLEVSEQAIIGELEKLGHAGATRTTQIEFAMVDVIGSRIEAGMVERKRFTDGLRATLDLWGDGPYDYPYDHVKLETAIEGVLPDPRPIQEYLWIANRSYSDRRHADAVVTYRKILEAVLRQSALVCEGATGRRAAPPPGDNLLRVYEYLEEVGRFDYRVTNIAKKIFTLAGKAAHPARLTELDSNLIRAMVPPLSYFIVESLPDWDVERSSDEERD